MKDVITGREDLLLAKIAGENVDIKTMTPPVAMNKKESLLLDIAKRLDDIGTGEGGSSAAPYEVDATIDFIADGKRIVTVTGVTAAELYAIAESGRALKCTAALDEDIDAIFVGNIAAQKIVANGETNDYAFAMVAVDGTSLASGNLDANDAVVLSEADSALLECNATFAEDAETQKETVTLNKTAADIWEAANAGKQLKVTTEVEINDGVTATVDMIVPIEILQITLESGTVYTIKARVDASTDDKLFMHEGLAASDTVVLTEV